MKQPFSQPKQRSFFGPSLHLGVVRGIPIRVHWSFSLLLLWAGFVNFSATGSLMGAALGLLFVLVVFGCVVLHELGHSLTAQRFGIQTRSITLSPIGGLATLESSPRDWKQELWITVAGPAVNAVIAIILAPFALIALRPELFLVAPFSSFGNFLFMVFAANVMLTLFNLIPAFPMDGGRILRALLTAAGDRRSATQVAARVGQVIAVLMGLAAFVLSPFLAVIGIFVFMAASAELRQVNLEESLNGTTVSDAMREAFAAAPSHAPVDSVIRLAIENGQHSVPIVSQHRLLGIVDFPTLARAREQGFGLSPVEHLLEQDLVTVSPHDELLNVLRHMQRRDVVPVVREERLVGLLPRRSIDSILALRGA